MKKDSLVYRYKKALKEHSNSSNDELKKIRYNYVTKLFFRIFLSTLILLCLVVSDKISMNVKNIKLSEYTINKQWNFLKLVSSFNAMFGEFIVLSDDKTVDGSLYYDEIEYVNGINYITNHGNGVVISKSGVITRIIKDDNNTYTVDIQTNDDYIFTYRGLTGLDYSIYSYLEQGSILGLASLNEEGYQFSLIIKKGDVSYDYYNFTES